MTASRALRVLVADDDPIQLRLAARLLRSLGHSGALASNGRIALDLLDKQTFDLLLLDLQMPVLGGLETLAALKSRRERGASTVPVVLVSGDDLSHNWSFYRDTGAQAHLVKPLDIGSLGELLKRWG
ncbi:MAG: response regulator [Pseudomonadota bacterium]